MIKSVRVNDKTVDTGNLTAEKLELALDMDPDESVEALDNGENLMIFPEHPDGKYEKGGVSEFSPGFLMLAEAWWKKSGKKLRILPVYANREERTFTYGDEIVYEPEKGFAEEQERILKDARAQMLRMAGITDGV